MFSNIENPSHFIATKLGWEFKHKTCGVPSELGYHEYDVYITPDDNVIFPDDLPQFDKLVELAEKEVPQGFLISFDNWDFDGEGVEVISGIKNAWIEDRERRRSPNAWYGKGDTYALALWEAIFTYRDHEAQYAKGSSLYGAADGRTNS